ncbi:MAG: WXG100 family type VII secretion target [Promicromonosporaceae bacterium]|nr:WXG100 family type VII secretion target [Promicromonosporaceae bacterium]
MRFEVDAERVSQASAKVSQSANSINVEVLAMMRHLEDLQTVWRGGASSAFAGVLTQWRAAQHQVEEALTAIQGSLASAASTYSNAEAEAARLFATR